MRDADAYDVQCDDDDETRYSGRTYDRDELDLLCGVNEPWWDIDPEGVMWL
jgi:hypothetical protein